MLITRLRFSQVAPRVLEQSPLQQYAKELGPLDTKQRLQSVLQIARSAKRMDDHAKIAENRVMGCTAQARFLALICKDAGLSWTM